MNYELAKQLKDAGFRQTGYSPFSVCQHSETHPEGHMIVPECKHCYIPTLEELIEACMSSLHVFKLEETANGKWKAKAYGSKLGWFKGSTPTEAVARLWLALNPKKA